jgi:hypothetical protein
MSTTWKEATYQKISIVQMDWQQRFCHFLNSGKFGAKSYTGWDASNKMKNELRIYFKTAANVNR